MGKSARIAILCFALPLSAITALHPVFGQSGDVSDPEAMRKLAATVPKVDIVGIRLGMSPQEVTAAIKAANPAMKVDTLNAGMERPGSTTREAVPHWMIGHTVGPVRNFFQPPPDYSGEVIGVEFTTPPARAVAAKIVREVTFSDREPVMASNLIDALRKKYGPGEMSVNGNLVWILDGTGKLIAKPPASAGGCAGGSQGGFPMWQNGWQDYNPARQYGVINMTTVVVGDLGDRKAECVPYTVVVGESLAPEAVAPTAPQKRLVVSIQSGTLLYNSRKATQDWLQQQADALANKAKEDASKRAVPKL